MAYGTGRLAMPVKIGFGVRLLSRPGVVRFLGAW